MTGYLFAGQGSQYVGMGKDLFDFFPESKKIFDQADKVLGFKLSGLCFDGPQEKLTQTQNCQPAILTMTVAAWEAFLSVEGRRSKADGYVAGLSLGEYSALVACEAISFEDAVYLVRRRGEFMEEEAAKSSGKMLSLIGADLDVAKQISIKTNTYIANLNCPGQVVISGGTKEIEDAKAMAESMGVNRAILLEVSGAFHCPFMQGASLRLAEELEKVKIGSPKIPLVSNVTAREVLTASEIKDNLIKQVASSVLWEDSMKFMLLKGVSSFLEFGPGKVLKGLMRRIDDKASVNNIEKKEDVLSLRGKA